MSNSFFISWFLMMFPLVFSPGPSNVVFAASGVKYGVKKSLYLMFGVDLTLVIKSLLIGFGLGTILQENPSIFIVLKLLGCFYLFYLAYSFLAVNKKKKGKLDKQLSFFDGVLIQVTNVKGWVLVSLMFSLFSTNLFFQEDYLMILLLVVMLCVLNVTAHLCWISFGSSVLSIFIKEQRTQNLLFSISLFCVALWFLFDNSYIKGLFSLFI